ncbi:MAG: site-2 protease family protein [Elusimicrobia bacterium]|nr:site-2 protease family protein [Elusimicrobiota bacterium]
MILSTLAVVFTFGLVIFLHEFGHYLLCLRFRVRVLCFAFGFGPELFGFERWGTRFSVCAIPLGGYVKPAGEAIEEFKGAPDEFFSKKWHERLQIAAAGPLMNYVLAFALFSSVFYFKGFPEPSNLPQVGGLVPDYPAVQAGLQIDDTILEIDGAAIATWKEMAAVINQHAGTPTSLKLSRQGKIMALSVTPKLDPARNVGLMGVQQKVEFVRLGLWQSAGEGAYQTYYWTALTVKTLASKIYHREKPDLAGPVGIMQIIGEKAHSGLGEFIYLIALISVAIGFFNILPIPILDGGHVAFYVLEGIRGKMAQPKTIQTANSVGLGLLFTVLIFATYNDISRIWAEKKTRGAAAPPAVEQIQHDGK